MARMISTDRDYDTRDIIVPVVSKPVVGVGSSLLETLRTFGVNTPPYNPNESTYTIGVGRITGAGPLVFSDDDAKRAKLGTTANTTAKKKINWLLWGAVAAGVILILPLIRRVLK